MKASPRQRVSLQTSLRQDKISVTIADVGPGIPRDQLRRIFEPFHTRTHNGTGIGLGLFIARRILQRRGGTIQAASRGRGAVFSIEVPVARRAGTGATGHGR
jgi:C4-dicarboxylate-specific signal transduction histidine kinase